MNAFKPAASRSAGPKIAGKSAALSYKSRLALALIHILACYLTEAAGLALIVSRVVKPGSKLSALTWRADTTLGGDLGVAGQCHVDERFRGRLL